MQNSIKYALSVMGFGTVWLVAEKLLGYHNTIVDWLPFTSLLWLILVGVFYVFFLKTESQQHRNWNYKTGVKAALVFTLYWVVGFAAIKLVYFAFINPDYFNDITLRGREWLTLSATSDENFENATQMMEDFLQLTPYLAVTTVLQFVFGVIYSLLIPGFVKQK
ncbi:MAG: DUF4199 domain-containing protein [Runella slithyformis]|nr:MAG: DUF4199 domain-containing protein [Runella slithyformis]TAF28766.1 MAG: DUF4199 domain-containing protein [Runella slithyformis]TAF47800.1 MAG: DUF4199 domain-containing protein [Runella slithyformis]